MTDLARYESLLADWREKEDMAARVREFAATGGEHHLRVAVVHADPVAVNTMTSFLNGLMKGEGWAKLVELSVRRAEADARAAADKVRGRS